MNTIPTACRVRFWAFGCVLLLLSTVAGAMEFEYREQTASSGARAQRLWLTGEIVPGDTARLKHFLARTYYAFLSSASYVNLDTPGGNVAEAMEMATLFRQLLVKVRVQPPARCVSACFLLYVAAPNRTASGEPNHAIGIHRPYFSSAQTSQMSPADAEAAHSAAFFRMRKWLQDNIVPQDLIDKLIARPSTDVYWLSANDIERLGSRAPWYEEWVLAKCPDILESERSFTIGKPTEAARSRLRVASSCEQNGEYKFQQEALNQLRQEMLGG